MAVYIIDKRYCKLAAAVGKLDESPKYVLIQDGVYLNTSIFHENEKREIFYIKEDIQKRNLESPAQGAVEITYSELIDLIEKEEVYNFI